MDTLTAFTNCSKTTITTLCFLFVPKPVFEAKERP